MSQDDIDSILENIQPPAELLKKLKPEPAISVSEFLKWSIPLQNDGREPQRPVQDWFTSNLPTFQPQTIQDLVLPPPAVCETLDGSLRKAILAKQTSLQHPTENDIYLPLWTCRAWKWANVLVQKQSFWQERLDWVQKAAKEEAWSDKFKQQVIDAILRSPWHSGFSRIQRGAVTISVLARRLLSKAWLDDETMDSIMDVIRADLRGNAISAQEALAPIANTGLAASLMSVPNGTTAYWGELLQSGKLTKLLLPFNVDNIHWIAVDVDVSSGILGIGDSYPSVTKPYLSSIMKNILNWLETYLPGRLWKINSNGLPTRLQVDSRSCGIATSNAIHRYLLPETAVWSPQKPARMRAYYYLRCIEVGEGVTPIPTEHDDPPALTNPVSQAEAVEKSTVVERRDRLYEVESSSEGSDSGFSSSEEARRERRELMVRSSKRSVPAQPKNKSSDSKKPETEHTAERATSSNVRSLKASVKIVKTRKSASAAAKFLDFKNKILKLDPYAEIDSKNPSDVHCSRCGKTSSQRTRYDTERFREHRKSKKCQRAKGHQRSLVGFLVHAMPQPPPPLPPSVPCPGLGHTSDPRIPSYLSRTAAPCGGAPHRSKLKITVLRDAARAAAGRRGRSGTNLKPKVLRSRIMAAERAQAKWMNDHFLGVVFSASCLRQGQMSPDSGIISPCSECHAVHRLKVFRNALRRPTPLSENTKFTPKAYRNELLGKAFQRHVDVKELMEMDAGQSRWLVFAKRAASGRYKDQNAFLGMLDTIMKIEDRQFRGKGLMNIKYDAEYDTICTNLALISPAGYRVVQAEFGGRTMRSIRNIQQKKGRFQPGIVDKTFDDVLQWAKDLDWEGPFLLAVDDTALIKALRSYLDGKDWKLGGMHGSTIPFQDYKELFAIADIRHDELADKVRGWFIMIPMPGVAPRLVSTMALRSGVSRPELREWHALVEKKLEERNMHHLTYNVDGASIERGLTHDIQNEAITNGRVHIWSYTHPVHGLPMLVLQVPLLTNGKPCIMSTDGKHAKKNARGSATSGARGLVAGRYTIHYGHLAQVADGKNTPLCRADIIGVDKQDDRAAARLFSSAVIEYLSRTQPDELGVAVYLFIIGEIVDAQQSRTLKHETRVKMLWRGRFFLQSWRNNILQHPYYSVNTHFITRELYDILMIFIDAMLSLILAHRDFFPNIPLLPWLHSTEVCEHAFGCARKIQKDFTFVEWILMIPKLTTLMAGELRTKKGIQAKASDHRSGYHHSWFDVKGVDAANLATFPSDDVVQCLINTAHEEAESLLRILGIQPELLDDPAVLQERLSQSLALIPDSSDEPPGDEGSNDVDKLDELLWADEKNSQHTFHSVVHEEQITNLGIAATSAVIHDHLRIDSLPEDGDDEETRLGWKQSIKKFLAAVQEQETISIEELPKLSGAHKPTETLQGDLTQMWEDHPDTKALNFGKSADEFNWKTLITARQEHETDEARSAITYRYRQTTATEMVAQQTSDSNGQDSQPEQGPTVPFTEETTVLKASMVTEVTRLMSATLTSTAKPDASGIERVVRWKGLGAVKGRNGTVVPADTSSSAHEVSNSGVQGIAVIPTPRGDNSTSSHHSAASRSQAYDSLEKQLRFPFATAGISTFSPLKAGSWVIVSYLEKLWLGQVKIIQLKGGSSKRPTHNFSPTCKDVSTLSRFQVLIYMDYGGTLFTPITAARPGEAQFTLPSFLYLTSERLVVCLDSRSAKPITSTLRLTHMLSLVQPSDALRGCWLTLLAEQRDLIAAASALVKQAASRNKHSSNNEERNMDDSKRARKLD